ncbi:hypothetical protein AADZ90_021420 [Aestuariibius sp. 2305UL40-4]|uniref:hypothetical protein n=1 Tax=Aestuariibius violaceus TaxID=3234132 RepID=UPI00345F0B84
MTDGERKLLQEVHSQMGEVRDEMAALMRDLYGVPDGSPSDVRPLIHEIRIVVRAYQRASWVTRLLIWVLPTIAGLGVAIREIGKWFGMRGP